MYIVLKMYDLLIAGCGLEAARVWGKIRGKHDWYPQIVHEGLGLHLL